MLLNLKVEKVELNVLKCRTVTAEIIFLVGEDGGEKGRVEANRYNFYFADAYL